MRINFYATLRDIVGAKTVDLPIEESTSAQVLVHTMVTRYPALRQELLNEDGQLRGHVHLFINGRDVRFLDQDLQTKINPDDVVNVFPAVGGG